MAIGSGLGSSLGGALETTYGTAATLVDFLEYDKETLNRNQKSNVATGLAAGRFVDLGSRRYVTTEDGSGSVDTAFFSAGMGKYLNAAFGGTVTPTVTDTTAKTAVFPVADNFGKSMTLQVGVPMQDGSAAKPYTFLGAKCLAMTFDCGIDTALTVSTDWDVRQVIETQGLTAPSYPIGTPALFPFHFGMSKIGIGAAGAYQATAAGATTPVVGVRKFSLKVDRKQAQDRFYFGNTVAATSNTILKSEPILSDQTAITGTLDVDFLDKTQFFDKFLTNSGFALTIDFVATGVLAGSVTALYTVRFQMSQCYVDGETPQVSGPGLVSASIPFVALADGTNSALTVTTISKDATL